MSHVETQAPTAAILLAFGTAGMLRIASPRPPPVDDTYVTMPPALGVMKDALNKELNVFANARLLSRLIVGLGAVLLVAHAYAITITMEYTDEGDTPPHPENPTWDPDGTILKNHFNAAKAIWETLLPGGGSYSFDFHWDNDIGALGSYTPGVDEYIEINPDYDWYADPNLDDDAEFSAGVQKLYGGLSTSEQSTFFPGTAPPGALEVSFRGAGIMNGTLVGAIAVNTLSASGQVQPGPASTPVDASNGYDLLSVILHEIGHALGISGVEPGEYNIYPQHVGGTNNVLVLDHPDSGHLGGNEVIPGFLMNPATPRGSRVFATATDVLVIAEDQGITVVQLDRVGRISSGAWSNASAWIGGDVPDAMQDVYISHGGAVALDADQQVGNLTLYSGANSVVALNHRLSVVGAVVNGAVVDGTLKFDGAALSVAAGGTIEANRMIGNPASMTTAAGSVVRFNQFARGPSSATSTSFNGSVEIGYFMPMAPAVTFSPGPLKTWTIAENLIIGDAADVSLAIADATWTVGGNVKVGDGRSQLAIQSGGKMSVGGNLEVVGSNLGISDLTIELGGTLDVTGQLVAGSSSRVTYRSGTSVADRLDVRGGSTGVKHDPPFAPFFTYSPGGSVTIEGTANVFGSTINVDGGIGIGAPSGVVTFKTGSNASDAQIRTKGGRKRSTSPVIVGLEIAGIGGNVRFEGNASAWQARIENEGVSEYLGGTGGHAVFADSSTAESAEIHNHGATYVNGSGGVTLFVDNATAGGAEITNHADGTYNAADTLGATAFFDFSDAGRAKIENLGSHNQTNSPGRTEFRGDSSAANAEIHNRGFLMPGGLAGRTHFFDRSTADFATIHIYEGYSDAGRVEFLGNSKAAFAHIFVNNVPAIVGSTGNGGHVIFHDNSAADDARITLRQDACCNGVQFYDNARAVRASFIQENGSGAINFWESSRADDATFLVGEGAGVTFYDHSRADRATFALANRARLSFVNNASAGHAQIVADGGAVYTAGSQAVISFISNTTADNAAITVNGATAPLASSAYLSFTGGASAGNATLTANGGSNGGVGATIVFNGAANGSTARLVANAGGLVDFFDQRTHNDISFGSIEGAGTFALRGAHVTTGSRNTSTIVTGKIVDNPPGLSTGGRLTKVGSGMLTLAGANTYSGVTTVNGGTVSVTGSIAGGAIVNNGGRLQGTGVISGGVTVNTGGVFAPGLSPGTLTVGGLTLAPGSALNFEIGASARDRIVLTNNGAISLGGSLNLSLVDGFMPSLGQTFPLFEGSIGSITGAFSSINSPIFNGLTFTPLQNANALLLQVVDSTTLAADFNVDGTVSSADLTAWKNGFGASGSSTHAQGDADGDADVDGADFLVWQRQLGLASPAIPGQAPVPEPATALLSLAAISLPWRRRGRCSARTLMCLSLRNA